MSRFAISEWLSGVPEARGGVVAPLCGLPMRSIFWPRRSVPYFPAPEPSSPDCWAWLPQPSWVTTKETAAWRFGA